MGSQEQVVQYRLAAASALVSDFIPKGRKNAIPKTNMFSACAEYAANGYKPPPAPKGKKYSVAPLERVSYYVKHWPDIKDFCAENGVDICFDENGIYRGRTNGEKADTASRVMKCVAAVADHHNHRALEANTRGAQVSLFNMRFLPPGRG